LTESDFVIGVLDTRIVAYNEFRNLVLKEETIKDVFQDRKLVLKEL